MKTIEQQVEELREKYFETNHLKESWVYRDGGRHLARMLETDLIRTLKERDRIAREEGYEKGHKDALRKIPVYETNNLTTPSKDNKDV